MNISELAVKRPVTVVMLVAAVLVLGFVSLSELSLDLLPDIEIPAAAVVTTYEGAGPYEVESLVTRPIEEALSTVGNVKTIFSRSERGRSTVVVQFNWGTNMDFALLDMREKLDRVAPYLPEDADAPMPLKFNPNESPILEAALYGDMPSHELRKLAETRIKGRLERLDGVASVQVVGGREREIRVSLDPGKLRAYNIGLDQVVNALRAANINLPGGRVEEGGTEYILRTTGEYETVDEIRDIVVSAGPAGVRRLGDIARVEDTFKDVTILSRFNGRESVGVYIQKEAEANTVKVAEMVKNELDKLSSSLPKGVHVTVVSDNSAFVREAIDAVTSNATSGGILAVAVLLAVLQNLGATFIVAVSIPISIIVTFVLIYFNKMTLNLMSLGGLALGVGMLVDNSIVVLENVFRRVELGEAPRVAAVKGANEVAMAIAASTLTTVAVFLPVVFIHGVASEIFTDLALTVTFSLMASLVVAMTLVPMLASRLVGGRATGAERASASARASASSWTARVLDPLRKAMAVVPRTLDQVSDAYARALTWAAGHRGAVLGAAFAVFAASLLLLPVIGREFLPSMDEGVISVDVALRPGDVLEATDRVVTGLERDISGIPYVESVMSQVGSEGRPEEASITVKLVPLSERSVSTAEAAEEIRRLASRYAGAEIRVSPASVFAGGVLGVPLQVQLRADDRELLRKWAPAVAEAVAKVEGTRDVKTSLQKARPELDVKVNKRKASMYGLSVYQVASAVRTSVSGQVATRYRTGGTEVDIVVRLDPDSVAGVSALEEIPISTPLGAIIPLKDVADVVPGTSPDVVERADQASAVSVTSQLVGRDLGAVVKDCDEAIRRLGLPEEIDVSYEGDNKWMDEAMADLSKALVLAIFLVYVILAAQFESLWQPLAILFSIPLAFIGVLWALAATGHTLNVASMIGVIMLAGIVVNNAIVLVDRVNQNRSGGMDRFEAIREAGKTRLRPIFMTTSTTVLGLIPLALGIGAGAELEAPIAVTVIGGLTLSTLLTLFVVPLMYTLMEDALTSAQRFVSRVMSGGASAR